jgi:hypothetical protein
MGKERLSLLASLEGAEDVTRHDNRDEKTKIIFINLKSSSS